MQNIIAWWFYVLVWSEGNTCIAKPNLELLPFNYLLYSFFASFSRRARNSIHYTVSSDLWKK